MKFVKVELDGVAFWLNPAAIATIEPEGPSSSTVTLFNGKRLGFGKMRPEAVVDFLAFPDEEVFVPTTEQIIE